MVYRQGNTELASHCINKTIDMKLLSRVLSVQNVESTKETKKHN